MNYSLKAKIYVMKIIFHRKIPVRKIINIDDFLRKRTPDFMTKLLKIINDYFTIRII